MHDRVKPLFGAPCFRAGSALRRLLCTALLMLSFSCAGLTPHRGSCPPGWSPSLESLSEKVAHAIALKDRQALEALCITQEEYAAYVWPELPIGKVKEWQSQRDFVWRQHHMRSANGLTTVLDRYGGAAYTVLDTVFKEESAEYEHVRIRSKAAVQVREQTGEEHECRFFGSLVEMNGCYKVFSYNIH